MTLGQWWNSLVVCRLRGHVFTSHNPYARPGMARICQRCVLVIEP